jgi:hypothetical protein
MPSAMRIACEMGLFPCVQAWCGGPFDGARPEEGPFAIRRCRVLHAWAPQREAPLRSACRGDLRVVRAGDAAAAAGRAHTALAHCEDSMTMRWALSWRADPRGNEQAKRHYTCQTPDSDQFVPPGRCLVLRAEMPTGSATWVTSWPFAEYVKHAWPGAWVCSIFRNEGAGLSSELIREAVAATRYRWPSTPPSGMVTMVDEEQTGGGAKPVASAGLVLPPRRLQGGRPHEIRESRGAPTGPRGHAGARGRDRFSGDASALRHLATRGRMILAASPTGGAS